MTFTQYSSMFTLFLFSMLLVPAVVLGLCGIRTKWYGMLVSIPALVLIMGLHTVQMAQFLLFVAGEMILISGYYLFQKRAKSEFAYFATMALSILPIFIVKLCIYTPYDFLGFVGISYISFRVWQLLIEIHDGHVERLHVLDVLYFITFFPTVSSGPIDRYRRFEDDLAQKLLPSQYASNYLIPGLKKLLWGIAYKFGAASAIQLFIMDKLPETITLGSTVIYMYAYTLYLFFDFAGYSHFAISTSYLLGIRAPENFNKPFLACNMKEFWDRWHISLSKWFGDYIFSRFVLNTLRNGTFKSKKVATRCGYMITMLLMGLWHGAHLFYLVYGLYQGLALVATDFYLKSKIYRNFKKSKLYKPVSRIICFHVICFGMLLFSGYLFSF